MAKQYRWRTSFVQISGGYPGEETGVYPDDQTWHTTDALSGTATAIYHYRDSDVAQNANSTKVDVEIRDSWTASIDSRNRLTITITTTLLSIVRNGWQGTGGGGIMRNIFIRRAATSPLLWSVSDPTTYEHTILGTPVDLGTYTFTLEPGQGGSATGSSIYYRSNLAGHDSTPPPSSAVDEFALGVEFENILPVDYRPGAVLNGSDQWMSHNRDIGKCHILGPNGMFIDCRTTGGGVDKGNPPSILTQNDDWVNDLLIGKDQ